MSAPLIDLRDQVAIITGSSRGIGRAIAETMARAGARVVISSRKREACEAVGAGIRDAGGQAIVVPCNISERAQVEHLVDFTLQTWGRVDTLVCNAASNPYFGPITGVPDEVFTKIMHNNVLANLWLARLVAPGMRDRQGGSIILVSSIGGLRGDAFLGAYNISKAADMQLVRGLAVELGPANIRVNAIAPGLIKTDFAKALWENPELLARLERSTPLGRIGAPDDIAGLAAFLASSGAHFLTGQTIVVDGGLTTAAAW
ncbi:SDR family oxidoreductase [Nannocystis sp.]|uniref:SDR family NAD(P)-dependent oxidoreductase n=1 Tax=Nannocystis sp. TaxID=1962667 RepID=UPI0025CFDB88|nr:SDR family oxidoreductase [Nannocystis sp.]MBK7825919.1 SDR family oxidoreductase [Nannocystis sp.]